MRSSLVGVFCVVLVSIQGCSQDSSWQRYMAAGGQAYEQGDYEDAEKQLLRALKQAEHFGEQDARLAQSFVGLATLYRAQGKYAEAEPLDQRALAIMEKALGPEHPNVAASLERYAELLRKTERNAEADRLEKRAKAIRAKLR